jgi:dephospho-CoA kinase
MIIGLTGGIGSGKTTVAKLFETLGCKVYNSDDRAKLVYYKTEIKKQVIHLLGPQAYLANGDLNKTLVSEKVFSNKELLEQLNQIIHPEVKNDFSEYCRKNSTSIIIKEAAILFETGLHKDLNYSILVCSPLELRIQRIQKRNQLSKDEIMKRISAQWSDEQKKIMANFIIDNNEIDAIIPQVLRIFNEISKR